MTEFDFVAVADNYAILTTILAGFMFAAMIAILSGSASDGTLTGRFATPLFALFLVFCVFDVTAFMFSTIPGHTANKTLVAVEFFIACSLFGFGVIATFTTLTWLFIDYKVENLIVSCSRLIVHALILVVASNVIWVGAVTSLYLDPTALLWSTDLFWWAVPPIIMPLAVVFWQTAIGETSDRSAAFKETRFRRLALISALFPVLAGALFGFLVVSDDMIDWIVNNWIVVRAGCMNFLAITYAGFEFALPDNKIWQDIRQAFYRRTE